MRLGLVVLGLLLIVSTPSVGAQKAVESCSQQCNPQDEDVNANAPNNDGPVNVILYGHFRDALNMAPMNTLPPNASWERDLDRGFITPTLNTDAGLCIPPGGQPCADLHLGGNQIVMFLCPGLIEPRPEGWRIYCHDPGLRDPISLVGPLVLYVYLSAGGASPADGGSAPAIMPSVRVSATLESGRFGEKILARGASSIADLVSLPGQPDAYEFRVVLGPVGPSDGDADLRLPGDSTAREVVLRATIEQINPHPSVEASQSWRLRTGPSFPPRLILPIVEPLVPVALETTTHEGTVFLRSTVRDAVGSYDIDVGGIQARIKGPEGSAPVSEKALQLIRVQRAPSHDGVYMPADSTWAVRPEFLPRPASDYTIEIRTRNLQGTYELVQTMPVPLAAFEGSAALPGFDVVLLTLAAGAVLLGVGRRRRRFANR